MCDARLRLRDLHQHFHTDDHGFHRGAIRRHLFPNEGAEDVQSPARGARDRLCVDCGGVYRHSNRRPVRCGQNQGPQEPHDRGVRHVRVQARADHGVVPGIHVHFLYPAYDLHQRTVQSNCRRYTSIHHRSSQNPQVLLRYLQGFKRTRDVYP